MTGAFLKSYMKKNGIRQNFVSEKTGIRPQILSAMLDEQRKIQKQGVPKVYHNEW